MAFVGLDSSSSAVLFHQSVDLLFKPVQPVQEHLRVRLHFNPRYVISRNFFAGLVEKDPDTLNLVGLLFHHIPDKGKNSSQGYVPDEDVHLNNSKHEAIY